MLLAVCLSPNCGAQATVAGPASMAEMLEYINRRYDDFFRWHREQEVHQESLRNAASDRKQKERARAERMERARLQLVQSRRAQPSRESLRLQWERQLKERAEEQEMLRRRFVEKRDYLEQYMKKGRQIPQLKEYDLEGY